MPSDDEKLYIVEAEVWDPFLDALTETVIYLARTQNLPPELKKLQRCLQALDKALKDQ